MFEPILDTRMLLPGPLKREASLGMGDEDEAAAIAEMVAEVQGPDPIEDEPDSHASGTDPVSNPLYRPVAGKSSWGRQPQYPPFHKGPPLPPYKFHSGPWHPAPPPSATVLPLLRQGAGRHSPRSR